MSAIMGAFREGASFVGMQVFLTLITAKSALFKKKTGMVAQRLSTLEVQRRTCSMKERNMASRKNKQRFSLVSKLSPF